MIGTLEWTENSKLGSHSRPSHQVALQHLVGKWMKHDNRIKYLGRDQRALVDLKLSGSAHSSRTTRPPAAGVTPRCRRGPPGRYLFSFSSARLLAGVLSSLSDGQCLPLLSPPCRAPVQVLLCVASWRDGAASRCWLGRWLWALSSVLSIDPYLFVLGADSNE